MEINFKIAKYSKTESGFEHLGYITYKITFLKNNGKDNLRIVVNGVLTTLKITITNPNMFPFKKRILAAIGQYENKLTTNANIVTKHVTWDYIKQTYSKKIVIGLENHLLTINKEEQRDTLLKYQLIKNVRI